MKRTCETCRYEIVPSNRPPCSSCKDGSLWETTGQTAPKNNLSEDKPQPSLIPLDLLIEVLEPAYREGLLKYSRESWRKGFKTSVMHDAALRHMVAFFHKKEDYDPQTLEEHGIKKHHIGAAIFCLISMFNSMENFPDLDDR